MTDTNTLFSTYMLQAFRLETLPVYDVAGERAAFENYLATGVAQLDDTEDQTWRSMLHDRVTAGAQHIRLRVLDEPINEYQRFEILGGYIPQSQLGATIHFINRHNYNALLQAHDLDSVQDFWLLDHHSALLMSYDSHGAWQGRQVTTDPEIIAQCIQLRDLLLPHSFGLSEWLARDGV